MMTSSTLPVPDPINELLERFTDLEDEAKVPEIIFFPIDESPNTSLAEHTFFKAKQKEEKRFDQEQLLNNSIKQLFELMFQVKNGQKRVFNKKLGERLAKRLAGLALKYRGQHQVDFENAMVQDETITDLLSSASTSKDKKITDYVHIGVDAYRKILELLKISQGIRLYQERMLQDIKLLTSINLPRLWQERYVGLQSQIVEIALNEVSDEDIDEKRKIKFSPQEKVKVEEFSQTAKIKDLELQKYLDEYLEISDSIISTEERGLIIKILLAEIEKTDISLTAKREIIQNILIKALLGLPNFDESKQKKLARPLKEILDSEKLWEESADQANKFALSFFETTELDGKVMAENHLWQLCDWVKKVAPTSEANWNLLKSARAKIFLMHLADTIKQIDFKQAQSVTKHLRDKMKQFIKPHPDGGFILRLSDDEKFKNDQVRIQLLEIPDEKLDVSCARKYWFKDITNVGEILDKVRFKIVLPPFPEGMSEAEKDEKTERDVKKVFAMLLTIFGTDLHNARTRYSLKSGRTNELSTGLHQAFHITTNYRHQAPTNGKSSGGAVKTEIIPIEIQIERFMSPEIVSEDKKKYNQNKNEKITTMYGMNITYKKFITDLLDLIASAPDSIFNPPLKFSSTSKPYTTTEQLVFLLFRILIRKDKPLPGQKEGQFTNKAIVDEIKKDPQYRAKLEAIIKIYSQHKPAYVALLEQEAKAVQKLSKNQRRELFEKNLGTAGVESEVRAKVSKGKISRESHKNWFKLDGTLNEEIIYKWAKGEKPEDLLSLYAKRVATVLGLSII